MNMQDHILAALGEQFNRWETLLASMSEAQIVARQVPSTGRSKITSPTCERGSNGQLRGSMPHGSIGSLNFRGGLPTLTRTRKATQKKRMPEFIKPTAT